MLTDDQVDELERVIFGSTIDDLPMILGKALPLLFAELRVVRATLDSKVSNFLGEMPHDREPARQMPESVPSRVQEPEASAAGDAGASATDGSTQTPEPVRRRAKGSDVRSDAGGDQGKEGADEGFVDGEAVSKKVGRRKKASKARPRKGSKPDDPVDELPELT